MKNVFKKAILGTVLMTTLATGFQASAAVGGFVSMFSLGAGIPIVLTGLGIGVGGTLGALTSDDPSDTLAPAFMAVLGLIILDGENGRELAFQNYDKAKLAEMGLTPNEIKGYKGNLSELGSSFLVVNKNLNKDSTKLEAEIEWDDQRAILGDDAIDGATKVIQYNIDQHNNAQK